jgi:pimeloyl-ACP methyl ester carboxylesterase
VAAAALLIAVFAASAVAEIAPGPILATAPSRFVRVDGAKVHYKIVGNGRNAIVFVHGWGGNMNVWREQVAALHDKARLVLIDLPGHGKSEKPATYSMRTFAKAVAAVLTHARVEQAILVGHSMGALVVRNVDRFYPGSSRGVIAVDGALLLMLPPEQAKGFVDGFRGDDWQAKAGKFFDALLSHATPALREEVRDAALAMPHDVMVKTMEAYLDPSGWTDEKISVPLLVIVSASPQWTPEYEARVRALGSDVTFESIKNADHFLFIEDPARFNEPMKHFLAAHHWIR